MCGKQIKTTLETVQLTGQPQPQNTPEEGQSSSHATLESERRSGW